MGSPAMSDPLVSMQGLGGPWSSYHRVWNFLYVPETCPSDRNIAPNTSFAQNTPLKVLGSKSVTFSFNPSCSVQNSIGVRIVTNWYEHMTSNFIREDAWGHIKRLKAQPEMQGETCPHFPLGWSQPPKLSGLWVNNPFLFFENKYCRGFKTRIWGHQDLFPGAAPSSLPSYSCLKSGNQYVLGAMQFHILDLMDTLQQSHQVNVIIQILQTSAVTCPKSHS